MLVILITPGSKRQSAWSCLWGWRLHKSIQFWWVMLFTSFTEDTVLITAGGGRGYSQIHSNSDEKKKALAVTQRGYMVSFEERRRSTWAAVTLVWLLGDRWVTQTWTSCLLLTHNPVSTTINSRGPWCPLNGLFVCVCVCVWVFVFPTTVK